MARNNVADFRRDVAARSGKTNTYAATPQPDGTRAVTKNGVTLHRVFYAGSGGVLTDANPSGDKVVVFAPDGMIGIADASAYLNSLT